MRAPLRNRLNSYVEVLLYLIHADVHTFIPTHCFPLRYSLSHCHLQFICDSETESPLAQNPKGLAHHLVR